VNSDHVSNLFCDFFCFGPKTFGIFQVLYFVCVCVCVCVAKVLFLCVCVYVVVGFLNSGPHAC
jgi:hypothetical protein